jgi:hypothetical protein
MNGGNESMTLGRLSELQVEILRVLSGLEPPWVLAGGGALVGVHTRHRETRDLDLYWRDRTRLERLPNIVEERLRTAGLNVESLQVEPSFARLRVTRGSDTAILDLIAEPVASVEAPASMRLGDVHFLIATPHEILVDKLCALLGRAELRDLEDVRVLLESGGDLQRALLDAPRKDGAFSPLTLAWVLRNVDLVLLARTTGSNEDATTRLHAFRDRLVDQIATLAAADAQRQATMPPD